MVKIDNSLGAVRLDLKSPIFEIRWLNHFEITRGDTKLARNYQGLTQITTTFMDFFEASETYFRTFI
jgi:hypothetical protein